MVVLPADHYIPDREKFINCLNKAIDYAKKGYLVTFGIVPTRPETGYGYIEIGEKLSDDVYEVKRFKEKPNQKQANAFIRQGRFLWNSGMFVWLASTILQEIQKYLPEVYDALVKIKSEPNRENILRIYENMPNISIDYGVMEHAKRVAVVRSDFIWDDVGAWTSLERIHKPDTNGNIIMGRHVGIDTRNTIIKSDDGLVATLGINGLLIVKSGNVILVCDKRYAQSIKEIVAKISECSELNEYL